MFLPGGAISHLSTFSRARSKSLFNAISLSNGLPLAKMKSYEKDAKVKIVELYLETKSIVKTQRKFKRHFKTRKAPSRSVISNIVETFMIKGSVQNLNKGRSGRKRTKRTYENAKKTREALQRSPNKSLRRLSQELGCSKTMAHTLARTEGKLFPYKVSVHQTLSEADKVSRKRYSGWLLRMCDTDNEFPHNIWFSDEANFHLDGQVNSQNFRYWSTEPPDVVGEVPLHSAKCIAWCAMSSHGIIGPFWFEDADGAPVTVNAKRYREVLAKFWRSLYRKLGGNAEHLQRQWFQQDGATAHTAGETRCWLRERFGGRLISSREGNAWPAHSPDLTPMDYFLWGHLTSQVYRKNPKTIGDLKKAVRSAVRQVRPDTCRAAVESAQRRAALCLEREGDHLEHIIRHRQ